MVKARWILGVAAVLSAGACDVVLGIPDRKLADHLACDGGVCACDPGFGDCDGDPANGCEASLASAAHCGACGNDCQNGACVAGACQCQAGFVDCDGDPKNGCEAELASDAHHCGACGHDCLGGACMDGVCQAFVLQMFGYPQSLSIAGGSLFLTECSAPNASPLVKLPVTGGAPSDLATSVDCGIFQATSGGSIYWTNGDSILQSPMDHAAMPTTFVASTPAKLMAATADTLYWATYNDATKAGALMRMPLAGGTAEKLTAKEVTGLAVDANNVYVSDAGGLLAIPHTGTTATPISGTITPGMLDVDATSLYVVDTDMDAGGIVAIPLAGGAPVMLAPGAKSFGIRVDAKSLYWLDFGDGNVYQLPLAGGAPRVIAAGPGFANMTAAVVTDDEAVYFLSDSTLYKWAK